MQRRYNHTRHCFLLLKPNDYGIEIVDKILIINLYRVHLLVLMKARFLKAHFSMVRFSQVHFLMVHFSMAVVNSLAFHDAMVHSVETALDSDLDAHNLAFRFVVDGRKCVVEAAAAHPNVVDGRKSVAVGQQYVADGHMYATAGQHEAVHQSVVDGHTYATVGQHEAVSQYVADGHMYATVGQREVVHQSVVNGQDPFYLPKALFRSDDLPVALLSAAHQHVVDGQHQLLFRCHFYCQLYLSNLDCLDYLGCHDLPHSGHLGQQGLLLSHCHFLGHCKNLSDC